MKNYSVFDILGPIMIGPSSSHTAGAARLGKVARGIAGEDFKAVTFYLHGSFAKTYKGHGTDRALVAGVLGMETYDERLRNALFIAKDMGIDIKFVETDLGDEHPNTVNIEFEKNDGSKISVQGASIGGGNIIINKIQGDSVEFTGTNPTLIIKKYDLKGSINTITSIIAENDINIGMMKVTRQGKGKEGLMILETDSKITDEIVEKIEKVDGVISVRAINPV